MEKNSDLQGNGQVGFSIAQWVGQVGISRAGFYRLKGEAAPALLKVGRRALVIESPTAWVSRIAAAQGVRLPPTVSDTTVPVWQIQARDGQ